MQCDRVTGGPRVLWVRGFVLQFDTSVFCNPCDNNSNGTRNCNPQKCSLLQMPPQHTITSFDQDSDTVRYFIMGGNDNNGQPAFQLNPNTGELATSVLINFEPGPRSYQLQVDLVDNGVKLPGIQRTSVVLSITIVNVNDPPLFLSPNVTVVDERQAPGTIVYNVLTSDEDGDAVECFIVSGNANTAQPDANGNARPAYVVPSCNLTVNTWQVRASLGLPPLPPSPRPANTSTCPAVCMHEGVRAAWTVARAAEPSCEGTPSGVCGLPPPSPRTV